MRSVGENAWSPSEAPPTCFVMTTDGSAFDEDELRRFAGDRLDKPFTPRRVLAVSALPRTRNGKVLGRAIRSAVTRERQGDLSSLDDPVAIVEIRCAVESAKRVREGR